MAAGACRLRAARSRVPRGLRAALDASERPDMVARPGGPVLARSSFHRRTMRTISLLAAALSLASLCPAQFTCNLGQPLTSANQGNVGGGIYFNLSVTQTVTFNSITYVSSDATTGTTSSFNMYVGPSTWVGNVNSNPGPWLLVASTTPVTVTPAIDTVCVGVLNPAGANSGTVTFPPGNYGVALQAVGHSWGYQNSAITSPAPGGEFTVTLGGATNGFLLGSAGVFQPRSMNGSIDYAPGGTPMLFAQREPYGEGCYRNFRSFYEFFPSSVFVDLNNTSMLLTYDGTNNRYVATGGTTPVNTAVVTSPSLGHLDNENKVVTLAAGSPPILFPNVGGPGVSLTTVEMNSNGYVNLLGTSPATGNPTVTAWLSGAAVSIGNWVNLNPAAGGTTHYDFDLVNLAHVFTWLNVPLQFVAGANNTFQMVFFANGNVEMRWGTMSLACGGSCPTLIGFTPGNGAADPGAIDISARLATGGFATSGIDQPALALAADVNPVLSSTVTLTTSNVTGTNLGLCFVTVADLPQSPVGLDLAIIGAPGCVANVDINTGIGILISNLGSPLPGLSVAFPIPAGPPAIIGQSFFSQSAWLDATQNALGIITSNAIKLKIGIF
jgi:hypothetical protein